ncbi:anthranilate phosphoribosyltransferase [Candidatus Peregrinibacteria bacterium]|jgi:anthranilate phosphoribosyltransferase|nr:anthranilate phosphoribosyltransferase [Candidatus Peregrinibacteria bacterium]MBT7484107.1 anthranilate phosphoribosyltransferase [Candidatus Peregrinibacteria bacterium]MBT7703256.1 anthranilate phosphoribosyltransferase [Candidatus Peregrinibacteria bacterium]
MSKTYTENEAAELMERMLKGEMEESEMEALLIELADRGETVEEITGMAKVMREFVNPVRGFEKAVDTCGTGGSGLQRVNTSTMTAFVLAAGKVPVAKHGNRAASGRCGSFDVLEKLGAKIELDPKQVEETLNTLGIGFMFAPFYHPAMKYVMPVRKKLKRRTVFNLLGPLTNPASVRRQILGVSDLESGKKMIEVLKNLGHERVMVVHGSDGLDELTITGKSDVFELKNGNLIFYEFDPQTIGIKPVSFKDIEGGDSKQNAEIFDGVMTGDVSGPVRDLVLLNSAAGFLLTDKARTMEEGYELALSALDTGKAYDLFHKYISLSHRV